MGCTIVQPFFCLAPFFFGNFSLYNVKLKLVMRKLLFVSMLGLFAAFSSCEDPEPADSSFDFLFKETQCANPWGNFITPGWTLEVVISYYLTDQLEVVFSDLSITDDGVPEACLACYCLTGYNIRISANDEFSEILLENGFEID